MTQNDLQLVQANDNVYFDINSGTSTTYKEAAIRFQHGDVTRFAIEKDNVANADLYIRRYNASGVLQDNPLIISGADGTMTLGSTGALTFSSASTPASIDITATATRAIRIGTKESAATSIAISSGAGLDAEPANNYLLGLFAKVAAAEATSDDELRGAWIRTRVNSGCTIGTATGWGYGVCGAEIQLKIYGATINSWQASALWAQLESQDATTTIASGCYASCVLANVGLTATTTIASGGVAAGVTINSNTAASGVTATGGFYGLFITQKTAGLLDFSEAIHIEPLSSKASIVTGNWASRNTADSGHTLTSANEYNACFMADDSGDNIGASVRNILGRTLLTTSQSAGSIRSVMGQMKFANNVGTATGVYTGVQGYLEFVGTHTIAAGSKTSGMDISLEFGSSKTITIDSSSALYGLHIETTGGSATISNSGTWAAIYIEDSGTVTDWGVGVDIQNCTTGIDIANAGDKGIYINGTVGATTGRGLHVAITQATANHGDGYAVNEIDVTLTGTGGGHVSALSSWINIPSGTQGAGGAYVCAQTNGVYEVTGSTVSAAKVIFGMRSQYQGDDQPAQLYPFSIHSPGKPITALIETSSFHNDTGYEAGSGATGSCTGYVRFMADSAGNVKYLRLYDGTS